MKTDPALEPPGWWARRQRTISATAASASARDPGPQRELGPHHHLARLQRRAPVPEGQAPGAVLGGPPRRQIEDPLARQHGGGVRPWPPAFILSAPPTEPGTPTAHSRPTSPAAALRRATRGRAAAAPGPHRGAADLDPRQPGPGTTTRPSKPASATSMFDPFPSTSTGHRLRRRGQGAVDGGQIVLAVRPRPGPRPSRPPGRWSGPPAGRGARPGARGLRPRPRGSAGRRVTIGPRPATRRAAR